MPPEKVLSSARMAPTHLHRNILYSIGILCTKYSAFHRAQHKHERKRSQSHEDIILCYTHFLNDITLYLQGHTQETPAHKHRGNYTRKPTTQWWRAARNINIHTPAATH